ncbi:MAG: phosphoribosylglycinamide formyltransferase [Campylobacteraceae bacterium]|nr:phosphoribosylglycinamide formyltransferase [Campylobacteraceae bacterium]
MNLAIFVSGGGTNAQAIIDAIKSGKLKAKVSCMVCDNKDAYAITRAKNENIPILITSPKEFEKRDEWEEYILTFLKKQGVELVILAGFMRIVGKVLLDAYPNKIINIHPSLLPKFPGRNGIKDTFEAGEKEGGITIHYADSGIDTGEIIYQEAIKIEPSWSLEKFEEEIHKIEHRAYPETIGKVIEKIEKDKK